MRRRADVLVTSQYVIPGQARFSARGGSAPGGRVATTGIQKLSKILDSRFRGSDELGMIRGPLLFLNRYSGFTLIEVVVSLTILGFMLLIIFGAFRLGLSSWDRGELIKEEYQKIRIVSDLITKQVKSVVPYKIRTKKAEGDYLAFNGKAQSIKFISTISGKTHTPEGLIYTIYQFKEGDSNGGQLLLYEQRVLNRDFFEEDPKEGEGIPLIEGVTKVLFEYYQEEDTSKDQAEAWVEEWSAKEKKGLPKCLRMALSLKKPDGSESSFTLVLPISAFQYEEITATPSVRRAIREGVK